VICTVQDSNEENKNVDELGVRLTVKTRDFCLRHNVRPAMVANPGAMV
jgi:hypothetical protein